MKRLRLRHCRAGYATYGLVGRGVVTIDTAPMLHCITPAAVFHCLSLRRAAIRHYDTLRCYADEIRYDSHYAG